MFTIVTSHFLIMLLTANFVIKLSRFRNKRHARDHQFCDRHRKALAESVECSRCDSPMTFF